jgi:cytochrome b561/polyisoprenoid-binding protein YceI
MNEPSLRPPYAPIAVLLHWLIAALLVLQIVLADRMEGPTSPETFAVFQLHKSIGITILILSLARLGWRLAHPPAPAAGLAPWERRLSAVVHWGLYVVMIGGPLTGWALVSTSEIRVPTVIFGAVPWPHIPGLSDLTGAARATWSEAAETGHEALAWLGYGLVALHVGGALKHQIFDRDAPILAGMVPGARAGRALEPRLLVVAAMIAGVIGFGVWLPMAPKPAPAPPPQVTEPAPVETPAPAPAAPPVSEAPATTETAPKSSRWRVEPGGTLGFATSWSGQDIEGRFKRWTADIDFDPEAPEKARLKVEVDIASIDTGDAQRDQMLPAPDWFDVDAHPKATFTARGFEPRGDGRYVARGTLSLRGVSRPFALPFRLEIEGDSARARGVTSLDRTAFGIGQGEWTSTDQIPAQVELRVNLRARRISP